jgi:hypothetical protein
LNGSFVYCRGTSCAEALPAAPAWYGLSIAAGHSGGPLATYHRKLMLRAGPRRGVLSTPRRAAKEAEGLASSFGGHGRHTGDVRLRLAAACSAVVPRAVRSSHRRMQLQTLATAGRPCPSVPVRRERAYVDVCTADAT